MKDNDRYLAAIREECADLDREQLLRRIAALSRRLDSETQRATELRRDLWAPTDRETARRITS